MVLLKRFSITTCLLLCVVIACMGAECTPAARRTLPEQIWDAFWRFWDQFWGVDVVGIATKVLKRSKDLPETATPLNVIQLIQAEGYQVEKHSVTTEDGYILGIQRIPYGRESTSQGEGTRPAVILQHGLCESATDFVSNLANQSLGFVLADAGFDVWLSNSRGNTYSRQHNDLRPEESQFWEWTWDQMGKYDLPAVVNYVLDTTGETELFYVGHSQGTTLAFAGLSEQNSELNDKIKLFVALAPVAKPVHINPLRYFLNGTDVCEYVKALLEAVDGRLLFPKESSKTQQFSDACTHPENAKDCIEVMDLASGFNKDNVNVSRVPYYYWNSPAGTSVYDVNHFCQVIVADRFQKYDWGEQGNQLRYNQSEPPVYDLRNIAVPVATFSGDRDRLAKGEDVEWINCQLGENLVFNKTISGYGHIDFIYGMDAADKVYRKIIDLFQERM